MKLFLQHEPNNPSNEITDKAIPKYNIGFWRPFWHGEDPLSIIDQSENPMAIIPAVKVIRFRVMIITLLGRAIFFFFFLFLCQISREKKNKEKKNSTDLI